MSKEKKLAVDEDLQHVEEALTRSERFVENNQKSLIIAILVIVLLVSGTLFYRHSYLGPKELEAQEMIFVGENYLAVDSFNIALNGDGANYKGFLGIIDDYGVTKTADLAKVYAGICYKNLGDLDNAIKYLKDVNPDDDMVSPSILGTVGDCYVDNKNYSKAVSYFAKAAKSENSMLAPIYLMKEARVYEKLGKYSDAVKVYESLKARFPLSQEGYSVDKYIDRAKALK